MIKKATNVQYSYIISGNGIQNGNPSPSNILPFDGCGNKTENLFSEPLVDGYTLDVTTGLPKLYPKRCSILNPIDVGNLQNVTITFTATLDKTRIIYSLFNNTTLIRRVTAVSTGTTIDVSEGNNIYISFYETSDKETVSSNDISDLMLNVGSQPLPYKPYGYVLPIEYGGSENLFDRSTETVGYYINSNGEAIWVSDGSWSISDYIEIEENTQYTFNPNTTMGATAKHCFYDAGKHPFTSYIINSGEQTFTTPNGAKYVRFSYRTSSYDIMLNKGSIPLPYVPYTPILTSSIYLGQVETTRNIKKLVLTGEESNWGEYARSDSTTVPYLPLSDFKGASATNIKADIKCTHYDTKTQVNIQNTTNKTGIAGRTSIGIIIADASISTLTDFKAYLQQQYAAGTPVTVWYVLAEPETTVVNEPLMKIGNYADTINNTQSGIDITTNNLTVNTTIPPSDISINTTATWVPIPYNKYNTETISTIAPIDFLSNGQNITVGVKGNTEQLEIPSPDNPVMPQGTGDKTENLFDGVLYEGFYNDSGQLVIDTSHACHTNLIKVDVQTTYTVSNLWKVSPNFAVYEWDANKQWLRRTNRQVPPSNEITFTLNNDCVYFSLQISSNYDYTKLMLNPGTTALPHEPYGYKISILSNSTTTNIYLGEGETTRKVKKLVLDGTERFLKNNGQSTSYLYYAPRTEIFPKSINKTPVLCNELPVIGNAPQSDIGINTINDYSVVYFNFGSTIMNAQPSGNTVAGLKEYLAAQYAAGTPVTVWYVLATPTTGIVNEPLMRIGDYADEVSNITVPTTKGSNTLSITTSVQPSNVQLSISGWVPHNNVKEYKNNAWMATSWEGFRDIVRAGNGPTRYPIGTKLYETWGDNTSNAWIIVDYDNSNYNDPDISALGYTHNVVLYEEKINYLNVFDNAEAWLYTETVLPAGTYRFTIPNYDATYGGNKTYIFTSTVDVPIHGQLTLSWPYQKNPASVSAYITNTSTTALFTATVSEWDTTTACVDLGTIKLAMSDPDSAYGKLNHIHRARYGSNNYYQSGIRQWMNADATANNWWKPTNIFDRPYSNRTTDGGLYLMDEDFRKVIAAPNITCITNNIFETGTSGSTAFKLQTQYTIRDKIFLPTHTELNLSSNPNIGTVFSQYTNAGNDDRIKYRKDNGNAYYYWFRTPYPSYGNYVRRVDSSGALDNYSAHSTIGAVRACIIQ